jgi:hypothetical protein
MNMAAIYVERIDPPRGFEEPAFDSTIQRIRIGRRAKDILQRLKKKSI